VLHHFDRFVLQQSYTPYNGFNFNYLFITSICLLIFSHIFNIIYWSILLRKETKVLQCGEHESSIKKVLCRWLPIVPASLPCLLFCRLAELTLALKSGTVLGQDNWELMIHEKITLGWMANDIKIIETVTESFGQLVIQSILLFRFSWLVQKDDFSNFGISFQMYVSFSMSISFVTMVFSIIKYHNRNRESLRPMFSMGTVLLTVMWITMLVTKVAVYFISLQNTPGFFFVPMVIRMAISWITLTCKEPTFVSMEPQDKMVYLLISFLVPVSIPSKSKKPVRTYAVSMILFVFELLALLGFALFMKTFYHFELYSEFYDGLPSTLNLPAHFNFESVIALMSMVVIIVALTSSMFLYVYTTCCHPSRKLFVSSNDE